VPDPCFLLFLCFRKATQEIFSELDETKASRPEFHRSFQRTEEELEWGLIAGMMAPEKSWCLVECPARWEPQEEGVMNTAARFSLS
jgi:hypothetical protein